MAKALRSGRSPPTAFFPLQARHALATIAALLADQGIGPEQVLRLRTFVVNYDVVMLPAIGALC